MAKDKEESKGNDRCTPGRVGYRDKDGTSVICIGNDVQTTVPYNPQTLLGESSNNSSNTATYQPQSFNSGTYSLGTDRFGSTFGSSGFGGGLHTDLHRNIGNNQGYFPPEPQQIQPVQTIVVNKPTSVVKQEVIIAKPVLTQKEIQAKADAWAKPFIEAKKSNIKAKAIVEKLVVDQKGGGTKVLDLSNMRLSSADMNELMNEIQDVNFNLDVLSLENTPFDHTGGGLGGLGCFMRIFTRHEKDIFHNVIYLNLTNAGANSTYGGDNLASTISQALGRGDLSATKAINLSDNKITDDHGVRNIASAMQTGNFKLEQFNLSGNKITDKGANKIVEALKTGKVNNLKYLDVSGNEGITEKGEGFFAEAMQSVNVTELLVKFKEVAMTPRKEYLGPFYRQVLKECEKQGVDISNVAVDKSLWGTIKQDTIMLANIGIGYAKCNWGPATTAPDLGVDVIVAASKSKLPGKFKAVYCWATATYDAMATLEGAEIALRDLDLIGAESFIKVVEE